ncbi:hypothetical protein L207DRAFT_514054 [Hyaloscypha variabilis F]|uniref:Uncharacterized protein n=1 Tax=Hyaloscypha variabilis (strain UAMH 11265 / GT02V1 / F) TaxID=1149755 RepID=A0A2J6RI01_HYAVF|nr:hypothetical protein L207DRAFT_514054 [Hyaloscypha variabilis F]
MAERSPSSLRAEAVIILSGLELGAITFELAAQLEENYSIKPVQYSQVFSCQH